MNTLGDILRSSSAAVVKIKDTFILYFANLNDLNVDPIYLSHCSFHTCLRSGMLISLSRIPLDNRVILRDCVAIRLATFYPRSIRYNIGSRNHMILTMYLH